MRVRQERLIAGVAEAGRRLAVGPLRKTEVADVVHVLLHHELLQRPEPELAERTEIDSEDPGPVVSLFGRYSREEVAAVVVAGVDAVVVGLEVVHQPGVGVDQVGTLAIEVLPDGADRGVEHEVDGVLVGFGGSLEARVRGADVPGALEGSDLFPLFEVLKSAI